MKVPFLDLQAAYLELQAELDAACRRVMSSGWYILGQEVEAFETEFAAYCGVRHCIGVSNGLDALELILRGYGIGAGDEVIVPANTFIATWLAVSRAGAIPVPVEPERVDPHHSRRTRSRTAITSRTRAVMPVHLYGQPADMEPISMLAQRHGLKVIEDAAQAHGARYRGQRAGGLGDAAGFSFYPGKNLGALGDGGRRGDRRRRVGRPMRLLRNYGSAVKYHNEVQGLQCAAGRAAGGGAAGQAGPLGRVEPTVAGRSPRATWKACRECPRWCCRMCPTRSSPSGTCSWCGIRGATSCSGTCPGPESKRSSTTRFRPTAPSAYADLGLQARRFPGHGANRRHRAQPAHGAASDGRTCRSGSWRPWRLSPS